MRVLRAAMGNINSVQLKCLQAHFATREWLHIHYLRSVHMTTILFIILLLLLFGGGGWGYSRRGRG